MYTEACLCKARMNHPRVRVNRLQAKHSGSLLSPDVVQLTTSGAKSWAGGGTGPCVVRSCQRTPVFHGDVAWSRVAIDKLQRAERIDCKLFVVGWQQAGWNTACLNAGGPWICGHWLNGRWPGWSNLGHCYTAVVGIGITTVDAVVCLCCRVPPLL